MENDIIQRIKLTDGCPNGCAYCYEPKVPIQYYEMPKITSNQIQILDMNFLSNPDHKKHIKHLGSLKVKTELVCGLDHRLLDQETANLLKLNGFIKIRWAWDYNFGEQRKHQKVWKILKKAGYQNSDLSVFMLVNWKTPYNVCCQKLDLLKVWGVKVNDCCFDGGYELAKPIYWKTEHIKSFRAKCRKHNQLVRFFIDPEYK